MSPSSSAAKHGKPLRFELGLALAVKLALLLVIWLLFFGPSRQVHVSAHVMNQVLLDDGSPAESDHQGGRY